MITIIKKGDKSYKYESYWASKKDAPHRDNNIHVE